MTKEIFCVECGNIRMSSAPETRICDVCAERIETEHEFPSESDRGIDPYDF